MKRSTDVILAVNIDQFLSLSEGDPVAFQIDWSTVATRKTRYLWDCTITSQSRLSASADGSADEFPDVRK